MSETDLISRQAAINSICRTVCDNPEICESPCDEVKILEIMPSSQPEPTTHGSIYAEAAEKQGDRTTDGLISRHDAYNTLTEYYHHTTEIQHKALREALAHVPTAQPKSANELAEKVQNAPNDDFISRKAAIEIASGFCHPANIASELAKLPSAQSHTNSWYINSWCIGCKEYDHERKCCPRYNRVIRQTLDEAFAHGETEAEARYHDDIVRCKDCKYNSNMCGNYVNCDIIPQMFGRTVDNFCSRAERRTDDTD